MGAIRRSKNLVHWSTLRRLYFGSSKAGCSGAEGPKNHPKLVNQQLVF